MAREYVGLTEASKRCAETHPRAVLSDREVDQVRELHEEHGLSYTKLAEKFGVSRSTIRDICKYRRRVSYPVRWKRVEEKP
jgi:transposase